MKSQCRSASEIKPFFASLDQRRAHLRAQYPVWKEMTLYGHLEITAARCPGRIVYQDGQLTCSYKEMLVLSDRAAGAFRQLGVSTGDRVAVNLRNRVEYLVLTFALAKIGAVKVPLNRKLPLQQKGYILRETGSSVLVSDKAEDLQAVSLCPSLRRIILLEDPKKQNPSVVSWETFLSLSAGSAGGDSSADAGESFRTDPAVTDSHLLCDIIYTSGSSGNPKGVMLSHDMILRSAFANCLNRGFQDGRRVLITVPLFHVYGYIEGLLSVIFVGGTLLCMQGRFDPEKTLRIMEKDRVNDILCVPSAMQKIMEEPAFDTCDLSSLQAVYCSASVCPEWVWEEMQKKLGPVEIVTGYGMSEVSGASVQTPPEASLDKLRHTLGKVLQDHFTSAPPLIEYRVVDPRTLEPCPKGTAGELLCRGAIVTHGYYHRDDVNADVFLANGWLRSGDLGYFDEDGYLIFLGRDGESYKINGENVSPQYLDQVISESRDVIQVQTVGVPDEKLGWVGVAFIEPASSCASVKNRIMEFCNENLASFQVPKYYFFVTDKEWPRTSNGKITKKLLREKAIELLRAKQL